MKIVLATPLYPPDIAPLAPYVKELAKRLADSMHEVTVVTYAYLPEKVPGVHIVAVNKRKLLPVRLIQYTWLLWRAAKTADVVYAQNGASVELPAGLVTFFVRCPFIIRIGDNAAHERAAAHPLFRRIEDFAFKRAGKIITDTPAPRPEILPFEPAPIAAQAAYQKSWEKHTSDLIKIFHHGD